MTAEIRATRLNASGLVYDGRARVRGLAWVGGTGAGTVTFKDGITSAGTDKLIIDTPGSATASDTTEIPGKGVLFPRGIYCVITGAAFVTVFYEG